MCEVNLDFERDDGAIVNLDVKASDTVAAGDFSGLKALADACSDRFVSGVVLYDSANLTAAPLDSL